MNGAVTVLLLVAVLLLAKAVDLLTFDRRHPPQPAGDHTCRFGHAPGDPVRRCTTCQAIENPQEAP